MAQAGDRFAMPDGSVYLVRHPAAESDGAFVEMEFILPSAACHLHPMSIVMGSRSTRSSKVRSRW
jgi:hypothetical protein